MKLHHPDRNGGSAEATRRFQEIQSAYEAGGRLRAARPGATQPRPPAEEAAVRAEAERARTAAAKAAREAVYERPGRPSDEELGYVTTDDSFGKILSDIADEISDSLSEARHHPSVQRLSDLIDRLDDD